MAGSSHSPTAVEVTWRQKAELGLRQRAGAQPGAGTQLLPQWLYSLKRIPQHTPKAPALGVHQGEQRNTEGRIRVCSPFNIVQSESSGKNGREQSSVPSTGTASQLLFLLSKGDNSSLSSSAIAAP